ncbi:SDR family oxidoreductase [Peredibacter starrii]|uniref:SDR family oxidoreductase n=1 Tax=Peredibacter starrii TaxID=28202 RepID=A0AAX4HSZ4_9BACT|nr:SDR family oxidoreductase [Peredibacter starrii]WPU66505.1 SDR family oxidoreductase [Peredibacter starrii]
MKIFVTGATGFIGSAVVKELIRSGHEVLGLARSEKSALSLLEAGAKVHRGDLGDLQSLASGAALSDGVIHTAFNHDFSQYVENCESDRRVIEALGSSLIGTKKPIVVTSGTVVLQNGVMGRENDSRIGTSKDIPRLASEEAALTLSAKGVNASIVRLSPSVHGEGDHGFVPALIAIAREKGFSAYVGGGKNRWPTVHRLDAARLFRLALEKSGHCQVYHGVGEEGIATKNIALAIGRGLNIPVKSISEEEASSHFGWLGDFMLKDVPTSSEQTRNQLGWMPREVGLIDDLDSGIYYNK